MIPGVKSVGGQVVPRLAVPLVTGHTCGTDSWWFGLWPVTPETETWGMGRLPVQQMCHQMFGPLCSVGAWQWPFRPAGSALHWLETGAPIVGDGVGEGEVTVDLGIVVVGEGPGEPGTWVAG